MTTVNQTIAACYVAFFGRSPDQQGLQFWQASAANSGLSGLSLAENIASGFTNNPNFAQTYGQLGNAAFVQQIYQNIGGNTGDANGIQYWTNLLNSGETRAKVVADFVYGVLNMTQAAINAEVAAGTITQADATAALARQSYLTNRSNVALAYTQTMGAASNLAASTNQNSLTSLQSDPAYLASQAILNSVTADPATVTAAQNYLNGSPTNAAIVQQYGNGTAVLGQTYTLTTGVDSVTASGNAVINGVIGTAANNVGDTLNPLDSIKATGANNTLNIVDQGNATSAGVIPTITVSGVQTANISAVHGETVNTTTWTGLTALNINASSGADVVTAAGTTAVNVTNTLATGAAPAATTVDGGSTVTATVTGTNATGSAVIGNVTVGGTTAATGAVNLTATETAAVAGTLGSVAATGAAAVTVSSTENIAVMAGTTAGTVAATGGTGAVTVTSTTNITETDNPVGATFTTGAISAKGGSSIVVNSAVTASAAALSAEVGATHTITVTQGNVTVQDGGTATSVTVNQAATVAAKAGVAATLASAGSPAVAGIGYDASAAVAATPATAVVPATLGVAAGAVTISGTTGTAAGNASNTITDVTLANYQGGLGADYINSNVLKNVTLSGSGKGGLTIYNQGTTKFTSLNLNVNQFTDDTGVTISGNGVTTLNVNTGGAGASTLTAIGDTALTTLNVAGTQTLNLSTVPTSLTAINVSGAAGFNDNGTLASVTASGTGLALKTTSSGTITATLHANGLDTFAGSTGRDVITLTADQTKAVAAGSATNDELVLKGAASTFLGAGTHVAANVSGFEVLGINNAAANGSYDMSLLSTGNSFNAIDVISGGATTATFQNVAKNTSLSFDASVTAANAFVYQSADAQSVTGNDSVNVALGTAANGAITLGAVGDTGSLLMEDTNQVGIATLNITSNGSAADVTAHNVNTIVALEDSGLSTLNVSGAVGLTIGVLDEGVTAGTSATAATSFTVNNTSGGTVTIGAFTDSALGTLNFTGSGNDVITSLNGVTGQILSVSNTGTGTVTIGTGFADANLKSLTLSGSVALGADAGAAGVATTKEAASFGTSGFTLAAGTDNAHINLHLTGANAGYTDNLTVGNGNDYLIDGSTAGTVNVTVGTGSNLIDLTSVANKASTYAATVTLGAHSAVDEVLVGAVSGNVSATATQAQTFITGAVKGDIIGIAGFTGAVETAAQTALAQTAVNALTGASNTLATAITTAHGYLTANNNAIAFQFGGNTYVVEEATHGTLAAGDTIVELAGVHTIAAGASGHIALAS